MNFLGIDFGTVTGWASYNQEARRLDVGTQKFPKKFGESEGMRFIRFDRWVEEMFELTEPGIVTYEIPATAARGVAARALLFGMVSRLQVQCENHGIEYAGVGIANLKRWATGSGNAGKNKMIEAANRKIRIMRAAGAQTPEDPIEDDNEADAILLVVLARQNFAKEKEV